MTERLIFHLVTIVCCLQNNGEEDDDDEGYEGGEDKTWNNEDGGWRCRRY